MFMGFCELHKISIQALVIYIKFSIGSCRNIVETRNIVLVVLIPLGFQKLFQMEFMYDELGFLGS